MKVLEQNLAQSLPKTVVKCKTEKEVVEDKLGKMNRLLSKTDLSEFYKVVKK